MTFRWSGTQRLFVDMQLFVDGTGRLIEGAEKNAKESVEKMKSAGTTDGPEEGIYYSWAMD